MFPNRKACKWKEMRNRDSSEDRVELEVELELSGNMSSFDVEDKRDGR